ncbi:MAG: Fic family protein [Acidimicrobiaceae bacterium]|nr:Fic family protein [Acidimicrobiia bacterium]MCY4494319.1 Fic family protein [Acidimicrobiaceae bacterium]
MIYDLPRMMSRDEDVAGEIEQLRERLRPYVRMRRRWYGTLRRAQFARAVQGSNSIEGYHASVEDAAAVIDNDEPFADMSEDTISAVSGYRDAMTFALQLSAGTSPRERFRESVPRAFLDDGSSPPLSLIDLPTLRSLHFMMIKHDLAHNPGQLRPGAIWVQDPDGDSVYDAPDREEIEALLEELFEQCASLFADETVPPMVTAAMAHLNLVLIHPFSDGNGRMARCVQSLLLAAAAVRDDDPVAPEFLSIEEYLGRNTLEYYATLDTVAGGRWSPQRSARPWIEFCLTAHLRQARTVLRRVSEFDALWDVCSQLAQRRGVPERAVGTLCDAARGWTVRRSLYLIRTETTRGEPISEGMASRDLQTMVRAGLLSPRGDKRGRRYLASEELADIWHQIRRMRRIEDDTDPYRSAQSPLF